jgi:sugar phosphate permease
MKNYRKFVLLIVFIMYTLVFGSRISIGVTIPALVSEFGMSNTEAGALSGFFFLGYFLTQVPAGLWIARSGCRVLVGVALCMMSLFLWLFGSMSTLTWAGWYRLGLGVTQGPISVGGNSIIGQWFPPKEQSRAIAVMVSSTMLAPILFPPFCSWFIVNWGWRLMFQFFGIIGVIMAAGWVYFIRSCPEESTRCSPAELAEIRSVELISKLETAGRQQPFLVKFITARTVCVADTKKKLLRSRDLVLTTLAYFFFVSVFYGIITWLPSYFVHARGMDLISMGWLVAVPWVGALLGALVGGWLVDHWLGGNPLPVMIWGSIFTSASLYLFLAAPLSINWTIGLLLLFGLFVGLTPAGFMTYPIRLATRAIYPIGMSVMNSGGNIGGFLSPLLAGILLDYYGNYDAMFWYFIVCGICSAAFATLVRQPVVEGAVAE